MLINYVEVKNNDFNQWCMSTKNFEKAKNNIFKIYI